MERARKITEDFCSRAIFKDFRIPVDVRSLDGYAERIKRPMDLGTVLKNLRDQRYATPNDWLTDIKLVFQNAIDYWDPYASWSLIAQYGVTELDRMTAGMSVKTDAEWLEEVNKVSNKLSRNIAERPSGSKSAKVVEDLRRRAESSRQVSKDDILMLVENLNNIVADDTARENVVEILKQVEGMSITDEISKKPIDAEILKPLTLTTLKMYADTTI